MRCVSLADRGLANIRKLNVFALALLVLAGWADGVGLGLGVRSIVPPAPVPLGVTAVADAPSNSSSSAVVTTATPTETTPELTAHGAVTQLAVKVLATASNVILQLSPLPLVMTMKVKKSAMNFSPFPFVALTACGYQWSFYGYFAYAATDNVGFLMLVYANILGLVLGVYYLWTFCQVAERSLVSWQIAGMTALLLGEYLFCVSAEDLNTALFVAGLLSAALSIVVSCSTVVAIPAAVKSDSLQAMPVDIVVASFISCVLWTVLGLMLHDPWVTVPNGLGLLVGTAQLAVVTFVKRGALTQYWFALESKLHNPQRIVKTFWYATSKEC